MTQQKPRVGSKKKKPPPVPLSTCFIESTKPVVRVGDSDASESSGHQKDPLSMILPHLYLGSHRDALDKATLRQHGIDYILNTAKECDSGIDSPGGVDSSGSDSSGSEGSDSPDGASHFRYMKLDLVDHADETITANFEKAFEFIVQAKEANKKVLVHCRRGISRSATVVIAYLIAQNGFSLDEAFEHVRTRRSIISPNLGFVLSLEKFANQVGESRQERREGLGYQLDTGSPSPAAKDLLMSALLVG